jgi:hypothetical protein
MLAMEQMEPVEQRLLQYAKLYVEFFFAFDAFEETRELAHLPETTIHPKKDALVHSNPVGLLPAPPLRQNHA